MDKKVLNQSEIAICLLKKRTISCATHEYRFSEKKVLCKREKSKKKTNIFHLIIRYLVGGWQNQHFLNITFLYLRLQNFKSKSCFSQVASAYTSLITFSMIFGTRMVISSDRLGLIQMPESHLFLEMAPTKTLQYN